MSVLVIGMCIFGLACTVVLEQTFIMILLEILISLALLTTTSVMILKIVNHFKYKQ